jgi:hypothetical protein
MNNCIRTEEVYSRMCYPEIEDWYECKSRRKHRAFHNFVSHETPKIQMYSLPKYDQATDTFKDGVLPKDVDAYFAQPAEKRTFYSSA